MTEVLPNSRRIFEMGRIFSRFAINDASVPFGLAQSKASVVSFGGAYGMGRFEVSGTALERVSPDMRGFAYESKKRNKGAA
jgi:hypothetical protein